MMSLLARMCQQDPELTGKNTQEALKKVFGELLRTQELIS